MAVLSDPISDFLTRFKNASRAGNAEFSAPSSRMKVEVARILKEEGYIWSYELDESAQFPVLTVKTKFVDGVSAIIGIFNAPFVCDRGEFDDSVWQRKV